MAPGPAPPLEVDFSDAREVLSFGCVPVIHVADDRVDKKRAAAAYSNQKIVNVASPVAANKQISNTSALRNIVNKLWKG